MQLAGSWVFNVMRFHVYWKDYQFVSFCAKYHISQVFACFLLYYNMFRFYVEQTVARIFC